MRSIFVIYTILFLLPVAVFGAQATNLAKEIEFAGMKPVLVVRKAKSASSNVYFEKIIKADWDVVYYKKVKAKVIKEEVREDCNPLNRFIWRRFYDENSTSSEKMDALKQLYGVDDNNILRVYQYWPITERPLTWEDFSTLIHEIEALSGEKGLYEEVVINGEYYNKKFFRVSKDCKFKTYIDNDDILLPIQRAYHGTEEIKVHVLLKNSFLINNEAETFVISYDGYQVNVTPKSEFNKYNLERRYTNEDGEVYFEFSASRIKKLPNTEVVTVQIYNVDGQAVLGVKRDKTQYDQVIGGQLYLNAEIWTKKNLYKEVNYPIARIRKKDTYPLSYDDNGEEIRIATGYDFTNDDEVAFVRYSVRWHESQFFWNQNSLPYISLKLDLN